MTTIPDQRRRRPEVDWRANYLLDESDWRPSNYIFTDAEMRDRLMRYGGLDAATAWDVVRFIRSDAPLDLGLVLDASTLLSKFVEGT